MPHAREAEKPKPLRRRKTAEASREELIEAAIEVIGRKGLSRTTLADVAAKAGIGYGNVTFRFKTKAALLLAAITKVANEYMDHREEAAAAIVGGSAAERIDAMIVASFHRKLTSQKKIALWHAFLSERHIHADYGKLFAGLREREYTLTKAIFEEIVAAEPSDCPDAHFAAVGINALIEGLWFNMRMVPNPLEPDEAAHIARTFLASLFPTVFGKLPRTSALQET
ncbi:MAG: TetR family transcriptional regulator C-terminal domain-containing protein [Rhizobiaceae bacterium]|nr:TetR family transcriptional regulator C-terminal domain-containing protein [Rhizobiaceae bacterium]